MEAAPQTSGSAPPEPQFAAVTVRDALCALTAVNQDLVLLEYGNVVVRRGYQDLTTVRLLGGGIGGAELSQAIFVGKGIMTAAILGEDTAPSSRQILHTIKELNEGEKCGIFVLVQGNSDLYNFGLAVERANADCHSRVKLLPIDDDRTEKTERYTCGFILLAKVLGAMAEEGAFFDEIYKFYQDIINDIITVPLQYLDEETGSRHRKSLLVTGDFEDHFQQVLSKKSQMTLSLHPSIPTVVLINTCKTMDRLTELGLVKQVIERLKQWGVSIVRLYYGSFVPAASGTATLTTMKVVDPKIIQYLDARCDSSGWRQVTQFLPEISLHNEVPGLLKHSGKQQILLKGAKLTDQQSKILLNAVRFACDALISCERQLNIIDEEKSSGNVGSRLKGFSEALNKKLNKTEIPVTHPYTFLKKVGIIAESAIGGTMGSIYGMLLESAAKIFEEFPEDENVTPFVWAKALTLATQNLSQYCSEQEEQLNMFYPIKCCEMVIAREMEKSQHYSQCYGFGVAVAEEAAQRTKFGKYKHPDAGAHAVGIWMRALFEGVKVMSASDVCDIQT